MSSADGRKPLVFEVGSQIILKCRMKNHQTRPTSLKKISSGNQVSIPDTDLLKCTKKRKKKKGKKKSHPKWTNKEVSVTTGNYAGRRRGGRWRAVRCAQRHPARLGKLLLSPQQQERRNEVRHCGMSVLNGFYTCLPVSVCHTCVLSSVAYISPF